MNGVFMEAVTFLWVFIAIMVYVLYGLFKNLKQVIGTKLDSPESAKVVDCESKVANVKKFIKESDFFDPVAKWKEKVIYRYVYNGGFLYEFLETLSVENGKFLLDDEDLYFDELSYKRVNNPQRFISEFILVK